MSNPLYMNDLQEIMGGMSIANDVILNSSVLSKFLGNQERVDIFHRNYIGYLGEFYSKYLMDIYVFCLSEHDPKDYDGRLSMWRGYGKNGDGAAIVFKTDYLRKREDSPLIFVKVMYKSDQERRNIIEEKIDSFCESLVGCDIESDSIYYISYYLFQFMKFISLSIKHIGFGEETEWRVIYLPERNVNGIIPESCLDYVVGPRGIEPKLKLPIAPLAFDVPQQWNLCDIIDRIILGPTISSPISLQSVKRMLSKINKTELENKVFVSSIPLRKI